jgi:hypothetical protein
MFEASEDGDLRDRVGFTGHLAAVDPARLDDRQLRDAIGDFEQLTSWAQAGQLTALAEINRRAVAADADADADAADAADAADSGSLLSFARGDPPITSVEFARRNIEPDVRPSFTELEDMTRKRS